MIIMVQSGFTGISYPFRVSSRGGCVTSTTSPTNPEHIVESIQQIFLTDFLERPMEGGEVYSLVTPSLFEPNIPAMQEVLKKRMIEAVVKLEPRIQMKNSDIRFEVETSDDGTSVLYADLTFTITRYGTSYNARVKVGATNA